MDYIKCRRNGSHHKNGRRAQKKDEWEIPQIRSVEKPRKNGGHRRGGGEHYKKTSGG